jgi:hypothetical protein
MAWVPDSRNPLEDINEVRNAVFVMRGGVAYQWPGAAAQ